MKKQSPLSKIDVLKHFHELSPRCKIRVGVTADILGVSIPTVWRLVRSKRLSTYRLTPRTTTFDLGEVRAFLEGKKLED